MLLSLDNVKTSQNLSRTRCYKLHLLSKMAERRIRKELDVLNADDNLGDLIGVNPVNEDDLFNCKGVIIGPKGTPYEDGVYELDIQFPPSYPFRPPNVRFVTKIYHASINDKGGIDCSYLQDQWSPALHISDTLLAICWCLSTGGNIDDPLQPFVAKEMRIDPIKFVKTAADWNHKYAEGLSVQERGLDALRYGQRPWPIQETVDECVKTHYLPESTDWIGRIVCSYLPDQEYKYMPFPSYHPWIEYAEDPQKYLNKEQKRLRQLEKLRQVMREYNAARFNDLINTVSRDALTIHVKTLTGSMNSLTVYQLDYVSTVKMILERQAGIPQNAQILIYAGKKLLDHQILSDRGIGDESTLHLVLKTRKSKE